MLSLISAGGMGEVYLAETTGEHGFRKRIAVKRILPALAQDPTFVDRFILEAKLAVSLNHGNLVQVLDLARAGPELFLAMEYVQGSDLGRVLAAARERRLAVPVGVVVHLAVEALKGLDYAHERLDEHGRPAGVVHCDISPSNLLVSNSGEVKVTDFGVAQLATLARRRVESTAVGKLRYMAPEMLTGAALDARTDLYSLAIVLREALLGVRPFDGLTDDQLADAVLRGAHPKLEQARPDVPTELARILDRAASPSPSARPASARELLRELMGAAQRANVLLPTPEIASWVRGLMSGPSPLEQRPRTESVPASPSLVSNEPATAPVRTRVFVSRTGRDGTSVWEAIDEPPPARSKWIPRAIAVLAAIALVGAIGVSLGRGSREAPSTVITNHQAPRQLAPPPPGPTIDQRSPPTTPSEQGPAPAVTPEVPPSKAPARNAGAAPGAKPTRATANGYLSVTAEPWAFVSVDGKRVGETPVVKLAVPPGRHRLRLERPGAKPVNRLVELHAGETVLVEADLPDSK